jgi:hypothetical protein
MYNDYILDEENILSKNTTSEIISAVLEVKKLIYSESLIKKQL